ncbi:MAG: hypothetical protein KTR19_07670 [Hyphomicrobiales bacterium]|nr:hypothetical protein [Hyphomicrobiales bacterium]
MKLVSLQLTVLALAGLLAASSGAQATGLYDDDKSFPKFSDRYDDNDFDDYCDEHPHASGCSNYRDEPRHYKKKRVKKKVVSHRCAALIRAAGKRNVVKTFARNSARFAWRRETRAVHGTRFSNWQNARNANISCTRTGLVFSCTARATPCKY